MAAPSTRRRVPPALRKVRTQTTVTLDVACEFLGLATKSDLAYSMATRYRARIAKAHKGGHLIDLETLRPRRGKDGRWVEIPNDKVGGAIRCRSDLLLWMLFPESEEGAA